MASVASDVPITMYLENGLNPDASVRKQAEAALQNLEQQNACLLGK